jgi:VTC domain-containing protein
MTALLDRLPAVGLDELVATAALQTRVDRKYILRRDDLEGALDGLEPGTRMLETDAIRAFRYESVYFDTTGFDSYFGAARRRRRRFKVRTRSYLDSSQSFLEVKLKGARSTTVKERHEHPFELRNDLDEAGSVYADQQLAEFSVRSCDLIPIMTTRYRRATLLVPSTASRATIDVDLEWELITGQCLTLQHAAIVETKSGSTPSPVDRLLWRAGHRPVSMSKYATGMAALIPELPSNKWARLLRTRFQPDAACPARSPEPAEPKTQADPDVRSAS